MWWGHRRDWKSQDNGKTGPNLNFDQPGGQGFSTMMIFYPS